MWRQSKDGWEVSAKGLGLPGWALKPWLRGHQLSWAPLEEGHGRWTWVGCESDVCGPRGAGATVTLHPSPNSGTHCFYYLFIYLLENNFIDFFMYIP